MGKNPQPEGGGRGQLYRPHLETSLALIAQAASSPSASIIDVGGGESTLVDDLLAMFGGQSRPVVAHLIEAGKLTLDDVEFAERTLKALREGGKQ